MRSTWLRPTSLPAAVVVRFVAGAVPCALQIMAAEAKTYEDVAFVNASDCAAWHAAAKVHAWYAYALVMHRDASFYGKSEDDAIVHLPALLSSLRPLQRAHELVQYFGVDFQWVAHCRGSWPIGAYAGARGRSGSMPPREWAAKTCAQGCWLGRVARGKAALCDRAFDGAAVHPGSAECPSLSYAPFAIGPLEVRSAALTRQVASCTDGAEYMRSLTSRGRLISDECASMDGAQGTAMAICLRPARMASARHQAPNVGVRAGLTRELLLAEAGARRQAYPDSRTQRELYRLLSVFRNASRSRRATVRDGTSADSFTSRWAARLSLSGARAEQPARPPPHRACTREAAGALPLVLHPLKPSQGEEAWHTFWKLLSSVHEACAHHHSDAKLHMMRVGWAHSHEGEPPAIMHGTR